MERTDRPDGVTIINDAYNANPESMRAALRTLATLGRSSGRRTWAVLGEMLELGDARVREHTLVGESVVRLNIAQLLVVGPGPGPLHWRPQRGQLGTKPTSSRTWRRPRSSSPSTSPRVTWSS